MHVNRPALVHSDSFPLAFLGLSLLAAPAAGQHGLTSIVSVDSSGVQGLGASSAPSISSDGRFVAFSSWAINLVPGDTNLVSDVFLHDRSTGQTTRVSVDSSGAQGNGISSAPSISSDARFVAFESGASNLVSGDTGHTDIFVHDGQTEQTTRVSVDSSGAQANASSGSASISSGGHFVAFVSYATNLVPADTNGERDVFVHDRQTGQTERVSVDSSGAEGYWWSDSPSVSSDGRFAAFDSFSTLVPGDSNSVHDVFVHDRQTGQTTLASLDSSGVQANSSSWFPSITSDGRFVAFHSSANNLVPGDTNGAQDVFVHDRQTGQTERVSVDSSGKEGNGSSVAPSPSISPDGHFVSFASSASNLVSGDTNAVPDVFIHDRLTGQTVRVSTDSLGGQGNNLSLWPSMSSDSQFVAFESLATNLVPGDTNAASDVFFHERIECWGWPYCVSAINSTGQGASIGFQGSTSVAQNDFFLTVQDCPPTQPGIFFMAEFQTQAAFGDGWLCATGSVQRLLPTVFLSSSGSGSYHVDFQNPNSPASTILPGSEWNFQFWYRDPQLVGNGYNLSNGLFARFCP